MRSYTVKFEKWILSLVMICLLVGCGVMQVYAANYDDPVKVTIPYTHIYDAEKNRKNDTFHYTITPLNGAPAPAGSSNNVYTFSVKGKPGAEAESGEVNLTMTFDRPGDYQYRVAASDSQRDGFRYESRTYTIHVMIQNSDNGGLEQSALVTAVGNNGRKYQRLQLNPSHESEPVPANQARPTTTPRGDGTVAGTPGIVEEPEPEAAPTPLENIVNDVVPKANPDRHYWAVLNLISAILTFLASGIMVYRYFERIDTDEDEYIIRRKGNLRLAGIVLSIISVATFLLTEDLSNPMGLVDEWTPFMLGVLAIDLVLAFVAYKKYGDGSAEEEAA